jgi:hypothetical protein
MVFITFLASRPPLSITFFGFKVLSSSPIKLSGLRHGCTLFLRGMLYVFPQERVFFFMS